MLINSVLNQANYPAAGDVDDCWVVATVMAALAADPSINPPTVTTFRAAAGDPDDGYRDGGTTSEIAKAISVLWPDLHRRTRYMYGGSWEQFQAELFAGRPASLAVNSALLPPALRYGFNGMHQIAVFAEEGFYYIANPLAPDGSKPQLIGAQALREAAYGYSTSGDTIFAAILPAPITEPTMFIFDIERWLIDGDPTRPVTTIGTPKRPDGTIDWSKRLAYVSDRAGANPRLELIDRTRLVGANNATIDESLTRAIGAYAIPPDEATKARIAAIKAKVAALAADIGDD